MDDYGVDWGDALDETDQGGSWKGNSVCEFPCDTVDPLPDWPCPCGLSFREEGTKSIGLSRGHGETFSNLSCIDDQFRPRALHPADDSW